MQRAARFGYVCGRCRNCCRSYDIIHVNPYEIARLAKNRGLSTAEFRAAHTLDGEGNTLSRTEDNACVFLGEEGCTVHADRPLVCRLYPLGRRVAPDGTETWSELAPHPQSKGQYNQEGTVADYVAAQGAHPFMAAADAYADWLRRASALLEAGAQEDPNDGDLLDMDSAIGAHCRNTGLAEPQEIEERLKLHLQILDAALKALEGTKP